jgi:hypothetical protein
MTNSQTALSLSDLPFVYSLITVLIVINNQTITTPSYLSLLIAGFLGTFVITTRPLQRLVDIIYYKIKFRYSNNEIFILKHYSGLKTMQLPIRNGLMRLSLKTSPIKYEKDKIIGSIYFITILTLILYALMMDSLVQEIKSKIPYDIWIIRGIVSFMLGSISLLLAHQIINFRKKIQLSAIFFEISSRGILGTDDLSLHKSSVDTNDWEANEKLLEDVLWRYHEGNNVDVVNWAKIYQV